MDGWTWLTETIPEGEQDAVSMSYLAALHHISERRMRREVEGARRCGILICSSDRGYFMPETLDEIRDYTQRTKARIRTGGQCLAPFLRKIKEAEHGCGNDSIL